MQAITNSGHSTGEFDRVSDERVVVAGIAAYTPTIV
jgi:hypothetical protein